MKLSPLGQRWWRSPPRCSRVAAAAASDAARYGGQPRSASQPAGGAGRRQCQLDGVVVVADRGTVLALAYGNGVVYAGGTFSNALPPGTPAGTTTGEVPRTYLAAFNSTTGALITSFNPTITDRGQRAPGGVRDGVVTRRQHAVCGRHLRPCRWGVPGQPGRVQHLDRGADQLGALGRAR